MKKETLERLWEESIEEASEAIDVMSCKELMEYAMDKLVDELMEAKVTAELEQDALGEVHEATTDTIPDYFLGC